LNSGILVYESKGECKFSFYLLDDGMIDEKYPGLFAEVLDEVAIRGNFTWHDSFVLRDPRVYNVEDRKKGIHGCVVTKQRVSDIGTVWSTEGCSDKIWCIENYGCSSISVKGKAGAK